MDKKLVARLTMTKGDGRKLIVDVMTDATHSNFYRWYMQDGRKRKVYLRSSNRTDGAARVKLAAFAEVGLNVVAEMVKRNPIADVKASKITIYKKRLYKKMLTCSADVLGLSSAPVGEITHSRFDRIAVIVPKNYRNGTRAKESRLLGLSR